MRESIAFDAAGTTLRGWLYRPENRPGPHPAIVMAHGFSAVKEMYLDRFAETFAQAGLAALVFDHRGFGASDGQPRQDIDPVAQARDYRHALSCAQALAGIDPDRLGVWGTSFSGGHVLGVAGADRRVKCVVSQVPMTSGPETLQRLIRPDIAPMIRAQIEADRRAQFGGAAPALIPVASQDPLAPCALPSRDAWEWFAATGRAMAPAWRNEVTLRTFDWLADYDPGAAIHRIAPTPLLMIVASDDAVTPTDLALAAYERAREPKKLVLLRGGHFDAYTSGFAQASGAAAAWFAEHLGA